MRKLLGFAMRIKLLVDFSELLFVQFTLGAVQNEAVVPFYDLVAIVVSVSQQELDFILSIENLSILM